jgi:F0F1-type ATP synthase epsilon subunit
MNQTLNVRIISPKATLFKGPALSISSSNSAGKFDILPSHANFITLIENHEIKIRQTDGQPLSFNFPIAIIYSQNNNVNIYTDIQKVGL